MSYGLIIRDDKQSNMILGHDCGRYPCAVFKLEDDSIDFVKDIWDGFDAAKEIDCPLMEAYDIKIVACRNKEDIEALFEATESWSSTAFQDTVGFYPGNCFIIDGDKMCRWYKDPYRATQAFPWAPILDACEFIDPFQNIDLEGVLGL